jgi:hypothetical protein
LAFRAEYRHDPLEILLMRESWTCAGCQAQRFTYGIEWCAKDKTKAAAPPKKMKRCRKYHEGVANDAKPG